MSHLFLLLACILCLGLASAAPALDSWSEISSSATCTQDTGGTCGYFGLSPCYEWRKNATCSFGKCVCPPNQCAYQGTCLPVGQAAPPPPPPVCQPMTGETCELIKSCGAGASCSGPYLSFTTGINLGNCVCPYGQCAVSGKCVESPQFFTPPKALDSKKIVCPVLAALYNAGFLKPDAFGRCERLNVQAAIKEGLNSNVATAWFFGQTTAGYTNADIDAQNYGMESISNSLKLKAEPNATQELAPSDDRYLNIFTMIDNRDVLHQIAAAVRGGPQAPLDPTCPTMPCQARFDRFYTPFATAEGRLYVEQLGDVVSHLFKNGYHGVAADSTLFTTVVGFTGREYLANAGFLAAFGVKDEQGEMYVPLAWLEHMQMTGTFPADWKKPAAEWGGTDVGLTMNTWSQQGVAGVSTTMSLVGLIEALQTGQLWK